MIWRGMVTAAAVAVFRTAVVATSGVAEDFDSFNKARSTSTICASYSIFSSAAFGLAATNMVTDGCQLSSSGSSLNSPEVGLRLEPSSLPHHHHRRRRRCRP